LCTKSDVRIPHSNTDFVRPSRGITRADICIDLELRSVAQLVETIAHELEHVVEQLDDVELTPDGWHGVGPCDHIAQRLGGTVSLTLTAWLPS
jgi:hypothetical protein